jgi:hypothetical protein
MLYINYSIIIVQVRYITIETKEVVRIGYNGFLFPHEYSIVLYLIHAWIDVLIAMEKVEMM